jgi:2-keto-3-deoxy-L-rhamnonate aldolase RhmA
MLAGARLKEMLAEGPAFGSFVTFASPGLTEFTARLGFDFTLLDSEHGAMDSVDLEDMIRASQCAGAPAVVRVPYNRPELIRRALDSGADGVQVPLVNTADDARAAVRAATFPPQGDRGVAFLTRAAHYGVLEGRDTYFERANAARVLVLHIETVESVENLDAILEVDGADVFFVGPGDLAVSMGYGRDPNNAEVVETIARCLRRIRDAGKIGGTLAVDPARARQVVESGARYVVTAISPMLIKGAADYLRGARGSSEGRPAS